MKALLGLLAAVALTTTAQAASITVARDTGVSNGIVLVEGGCGRDYHRGPRGYCVPNWREWQPGWRACPPGWHLGPERRRCWPN